MFFGQLKNTLPTGACTFKTSEGHHIYCRFNNEGGSSMYLDQKGSYFLQEVRINKVTL